MHLGYHELLRHTDCQSVDSSILLLAGFQLYFEQVQQVPAPRDQVPEVVQFATGFQLPNSLRASSDTLRTAWMRMTENVRSLNAVPLPFSRNKQRSHRQKQFHLVAVADFQILKFHHSNTHCYGCA